MIFLVKAPIKPSIPTLILLLLLSLTPLYPYNYSWSNHEDITTPNPPPCTSRCGCDSSGNPISCECPPNTCCFNNDGASSPGAGGWGTYRVPLHPVDTTNTYGCSGFFLHSGKYPGSKGCIDIGTEDIKIFPKLKKLQGKVPLYVD